MCPRCMCQSLVVSSVATEASPTMMLPIILYKFVVCSPLRIVKEPLVTLTPHLHLRTCTLELPKLPTREFFLGSETCPTFVRVHTYPSNILIQMYPVPTVLHTMFVTHQDRASIERLICTKPLTFWAHVICAPRVK